MRIRRPIWFGLVSLVLAVACLAVGCNPAPSGGAGGSADPIDNGNGNDNGNDNGDEPVDPCDVPGVICTVAGTGQSLFDGDGRDALETSFYIPLDVDFDAQNRPLIVDYNNLRIRRLNDNGHIETIMGLDFEAYPVDGTLAIDTPLHHPSDIEFDRDGTMYVAGDHAPVVFIVGQDQRVYTLAGNGEFGYSGDGGPALEASMTTPFGVMPDDQGGFYVSDFDEQVVRYVTADGIIDAVAGTGVRGFSGDGGPGVEAQVSGPTRMRLDATGRLYFCDTDNHAIRRLEPDGTIRTIAGNGTPGYSGDGGPATDAVLDSPYDLRFSPGGDLYIAELGNNVIRRIDAAGIIDTVVGSGVKGFDGDGGRFETCALNGPSGIIFDDQGSLWIADAYNHRIRKVSGFLAEMGD